MLFQLFSAAEEEVALDVGADPATAASVMLRMKHAFNPAATAPPTLPPAPQNSNGQPGQLPETPAGGGGPADEERKPKKPRKEKPAVT